MLGGEQYFARNPPVDDSSNTVQSPRFLAGNELNVTTPSTSTISFQPNSQIYLDTYTRTYSTPYRTDNIAGSSMTSSTQNIKYPINQVAQINSSDISYQQQFNGKPSLDSYNKIQETYSPKGSSNLNSNGSTLNQLSSGAFMNVKNKSYTDRSYTEHIAPQWTQLNSGFNSKWQFPDSNQFSVKKESGYQYSNSSQSIEKSHSSLDNNFPRELKTFTTNSPAIEYPFTAASTQSHQSSLGIAFKQQSDSFEINSLKEQLSQMKLEKENLEKSHKDLQIRYDAQQKEHAREIAQLKMNMFNSVVESDRGYNGKEDDDDEDDQFDNNYSNDRFHSSNQNQQYQQFQLDQSKKIEDVAQDLINSIEIIDNQRRENLFAKKVQSDMKRDPQHTQYNSTKPFLSSKPEEYSENQSLPQIRTNDIPFNNYLSTNTRNTTNNDSSQSSVNRANNKKPNSIGTSEAIEQQLELVKYENRILAEEILALKDKMIFISQESGPRERFELLNQALSSLKQKHQIELREWQNRVETIESEMKKINSLNKTLQNEVMIRAKEEAGGAWNHNRTSTMLDEKTLENLFDSDFGSDADDDLEDDGYGDKDSKDIRRHRNEILGSMAHNEKVYNNIIYLKSKNRKLHDQLEEWKRMYWLLEKSANQPQNQQEQEDSISQQQQQKQQQGSQSQTNIQQQPPSMYEFNFSKYLTTPAETASPQNIVPRTFEDSHMNLSDFLNHGNQKQSSIDINTSQLNARISSATEDDFRNIEKYSNEKTNQLKLINHPFPSQMNGQIFNSNLNKFNNGFDGHKLGIGEQENSRTHIEGILESKHTPEQESAIQTNMNENKKVESEKFISPGLKLNDQLLRDKGKAITSAVTSPSNLKGGSGTSLTQSKSSYATNFFTHFKQANSQPKKEGFVFNNRHSDFVSSKQVPQSARGENLNLSTTLQSSRNSHNQSQKIQDKPGSLQKPKPTTVSQLLNSIQKTSYISSQLNSATPINQSYNWKSKQSKSTRDLKTATNISASTSQKANGISGNLSIDERNKSQNSRDNSIKNQEENIQQVPYSSPKKALISESLKIDSNQISHSVQQSPHGAVVSKQGVSNGQRGIGKTTTNNFVYNNKFTQRPKDKYS